MDDKNGVSMITSEQVEVMLSMQDRMNATVNPAWRTAGYNWMRAVMMEAAEAMEHHGWKWWKKQVPDMPQVRMELVDIWHFMLSQIIVEGRGRDNEFLADDIVHHLSQYNVRENTPALIDSLQSLAGSGAAGILDIKAFSAALVGSDMSWEDLYSTYVAKNILNQFRQANGYKTGEYIKDWSVMKLTHTSIDDRALEDNDHLHDIMQIVPSSAEKYEEALIANLEHRYARVKGERSSQEEGV